MKKTVKALGITAALAVMIPLSAYAATTSTTGSTTGEKTEASTKSVNGGLHEGRSGMGRMGGGMVSQEVLDLLKLDKAAFKEKIEAGATLAKIAEEQGVSRYSLKSVMTEAFNKQLEERKQDFADNLDKLIDSDLQADKHHAGKMRGLHMSRDLTAVADVIGLTADEVKEQLKAGKSLADIAADKGVDVQKVIEAQEAAIVSAIDEAVKAGKLTQEQADKQLVNVADIAEKIVNGKGFSEGRHPGGGKGHGFDGAKPTADAHASETAE